jgi:2-oxoglutarate/2-oxoacid ferredoxin oxidoreductase subunit alpha
MNMGQISREVKRVNEGISRIEKHNRIDGQFITPEEILTRLLSL